MKQLLSICTTGHTTDVIMGISQATISGNDWGDVKRSWRHIDRVAVWLFRLRVWSTYIHRFAHTYSNYTFFWFSGEKDRVILLGIYIVFSLRCTALVAFEENTSRIYHLTVNLHIPTLDCLLIPVPVIDGQTPASVLEAGEMNKTLCTNSAIWNH